MSRTPGIDVSRWQGEINWQPIAAAGYRFAVIRATVGNYYTDPRFYENWRGAHEHGLLVSAYHVVKPKQTAQSQMDRLCDALGKRKPDLPLVLDVELTDDKPASTITQVVKGCADEIERRAGRKPVIYTGSWFWNPNIDHSLDWDAYDLWIAHYGVQSPTLPKGWADWKIWQYSETGSVTGVSSHRTDLNWFNGSYEELRAYANRPAAPPPAPDEESTATTEDAPGVEEPAAAVRARLRITNTFLRVRSGPGVHYDHLDDLADGDEVEMLDIEGKEVWIAVGPGRWIAMIYNGTRYAALVD